MPQNFLLNPNFRYAFAFRCFLLLLFLRNCVLPRECVTQTYLYIYLKGGVQASRKLGIFSGILLTFLAYLPVLQKTRKNFFDFIYCMLFFVVSLSVVPFLYFALRQFYVIINLLVLSLSFRFEKL